MIKVLVVEDEADILDNIVDTLEAEGYAMYAAENGLVGTQYAFEQRPDLVICDIMLPELDGFGVLQALRDDPRTATIPFIFLTALGDRAHMRQGMTMGADDYIPKPFTQAELLEAVSARIERQTPVNALHEQVVQLTQSDQLKSDMIQLAAHDLKNPIAAISLTTESIRRYYGDTLCEKHLNAIGRIEAAASHMSSITGEILSLERIEDALKLDNVPPVDFIQLVESVYQEYEPTAREHAQSLQLESAPTPLLVAGDLPQLREAVHNLIGNAIKYTPDGGRIVVSLKQKANHVQFAVLDNGYGIPEEHHASLFQPFYRAKSETTSHIEGTGLGLHLVKRIIERHHGRILFSSVYGKGSKFGFILPIAESV